MTRPNRSRRFCDSCEVSPCSLSRSKISAMIVFSVSVRRYGSRKMVSGIRTGILAAELGDDVAEVLLRSESLLFEHFHKRGNCPHIGDGRFLDSYGVAPGTVVAHLPFGFHSRTRLCASAIWAGVICLARSSRYPGACAFPFPAAKLYHMWAWTKSRGPPSPKADWMPR